MQEVLIVNATFRKLSIPFFHTPLFSDAEVFQALCSAEEFIKSLSLVTREAKGEQQKKIKTYRSTLMWWRLLATANITLYNLHNIPVR